MIKQAYVLDNVVRDVPAAERFFTTVFGVKPIPQHADMDASGAGVAVHYTVEGLYAVGFMGLRDPERRFPPPSRVPTQYSAWIKQQRLARQGEGPFLLGFLVDDLDKHIAALQSRGVRFLTRETVRYMVGRNIVVDPRTTFGMTVYFGQHDQDAYDRWIATDPSRAPKDVKRSARRPYVVATAVHDLDAATPVFEDVLQRKGIPMQPELDGFGQYLEGVHFDVGGLQSFALVALRDPTRRYLAPSVEPTQLGAWLVQRQLDTVGEGLFLLGLRVDDLDADVGALRALGIKFLLDAPAAHAVGRINVVDPATTFGTTVALVQHAPDAYAQWRSKPQ